MARNCRFAIAVHVATVLALKEGEAATSDWIAGSVNTNPVVVRRILSALAKASLVVSHRGVAGGSVLARAPGAITLKDLHQAVAEPIGPATHHQAPNPACPVGAHIVPVLQDILARAEAAKEADLARITVGDVLAMVRDKTKAA